MTTKVYIDTKNKYPTSGIILTEVTNTFDNSQSTLIEQFNQMSISSGQEFAKVIFLQPYKTICKFVEISGKISITLPKSQGTKIIPINFIQYSDLELDGFTVRTDKVDGAAYSYEFNYRSIGI